MAAHDPPRDARDDDAGSDHARALHAWREHDTKHALHGADREAIRTSDAPRALVLELLARPGPGRDLYNACARLGRLLADAGASPSLAVATIEGAALALEGLGAACDVERLSPARASVAEGYFAVVIEGERASARRAWDYPACAVRVSKDTVAIVAGYPADDGEALADWSARVALKVSREGYKHAIVTGSDAAKAELGQALSMLGVRPAVGPAAGPARGVGPASSAANKGWLASLLKR
jgi:hypothetical protein